MFYFDLLEQFYKNNIRYLIVGGLAVNLYGVPRLPVNPDEMANSETVKQWTEERNRKAFSFYHKKENYKVLDIVLDHPLDFEKAFSDKTVKSAGGIDINLVSIDDLITMKTASGRGQDISDIAMLEKVRKYLEESNG